MRTPSGDEERLQLLNHFHPEHPWKSCDEERHCIVCARSYRGWEVTIWIQYGRTHFACPGCRSDLGMWVRPGDPMVDASIWSDWESAIQRWENQREWDPDEALATH